MGKTGCFFLYKNFPLLLQYLSAYLSGVALAKTDGGLVQSFVFWRITFLHPF